MNESRVMKDVHTEAVMMQKQLGISNQNLWKSSEPSHLVIEVEAVHILFYRKRPRWQDKHQTCNR